MSVITPVRVLLMEAEFEEDADLLFAGLAILSLGKASKKMQDQRKKLKDKKIEAELAKTFTASHHHHNSPKSTTTGLEGKLARVQMESSA